MSFVSTPEPAADGGALRLAQRLAAEAGRGTPRALTRLAGGRNNRVYRVDTDDGPLVLKHYFSDMRDDRDRLGAEWSFISHVWSRGLCSVPEPLARNCTAQAALYGFVPGRKLVSSELTAAHVDAAIDFVLAANAPPRPALTAASEACFSLAEHVATVERRVARLDRLDADVPHVDEARRLVATRLWPAWTAVQARLATGAAAVGLMMDRALRSDETCLSPSDFGFHNALVDEAGQLTFLDFEYAGRDDPAKLVSDFFCQPEVPVPLSLHSHVIARLAEGLGLDDAGVARCQLLLDAYQVKWACIILNDFLPLGAARRAFADPGAWAERCAGQIEKAHAGLALIGGALETTSV
jgi:Phosphotransferase enzyme family